MATQLKPVDVAVIGLGAAGGVAVLPLARAGLMVAALEAGQLQYRVSSMHGNPWLRLLRREVEDLMATTHNDTAHRQKRAKAELLRVNKELQQLRSQVAALEEQRNNLLAELDGS